MDTRPDPLSLAWLAGLFEGEGCMTIARNGGTRLTIRMTDRDVIERVNAIFPSTRIQVVEPKRVRPEYSQPKTQYGWRVSNPGVVREVLTALLPMLGERRAAKAREVLSHLNSRPGTGGPNRAKTKCLKGHPYSPENTYVNPVKGHRGCRLCRTEYARAYRKRKSSAQLGQVISA